MRMSKILLRTAPILLLPLISGCDWFSGQKSESDMRNVEILPGTASDEMITLDSAAGDGTAIDPSTATGPATPAAASEGDASDAEDKGTDAAPADGANGGDQVIAPPASDAPAKNNR